MTSWVIQNNNIQIQDGGQPPYCKMLETPYLAYQYTDFSRCRTAAMLENVGNVITRLPVDRLAQKVGGRIQPTPVP